MSIYSSNVKIMISAIKYASRVIIRDFYEIAKLQNSHNKSGVKKFLDRAYEKSKTIIEDELQRFRPNLGLSQEENEKCYWKIEPIDGQHNFFHAIPFFGISISLIEDNEVTALVIILPTSGELFWAEKGVGSYLEDLNTSKLRLGDIKYHQYVIVGLGGINSQIFKAVQHMQYRIMGSTSVSIAYAAIGKIDALIYAKSSLDHSLLIKEASGLVLHVDNYTIVGGHDVVSTLAGRIKGE